jgi:hypothetical protein
MTRQALLFLWIGCALAGARVQAEADVCAGRSCRAGKTEADDVKCLVDGRSAPSAWRSDPRRARWWTESRYWCRAPWTPQK